MSVQAWFPAETWPLEPGQELILPLTVENAGANTETFTVVPTGLNASWVMVNRTNVTMFAGSREVIEVAIRGPKLYSTPAGANSVSVRVMPQSDPEGSAVAEASLEMGSFDERAIVLLQPVLRARRRATFEFLVENRGNSLANCRLHLVDATERVDGQFDPPSVGIPPGSSSLVRLEAKTQHNYFQNTDRQLEFEIEATEPNHAPVSARAVLVQSRLFSSELLRWAVGVLAFVLAMLVAWGALVRPAIDRAVDDALARRPAVTAPVSPAQPTGTTPTGNTTAATVPSAGVSGDGDPWSTRIQASADLNQSVAESVRVPDGQRLLLTDIVLQNPGGDDGRARLTRGEDVLYEWDLGAMVVGNDFQPRISALPFEAGDEISLSVDCVAVGDPAATSCDVAVLLTGTLQTAGG